MLFLKSPVWGDINLLLRHIIFSFLFNSESMKCKMQLVSTELYAIIDYKAILKLFRKIWINMRPVRILYWIFVWGPFKEKIYCSLPTKKQLSSEFYCVWLSAHSPLTPFKKFLRKSWKVCSKYLECTGISTGWVIPSRAGSMASR